MFGVYSRILKIWSMLSREERFGALVLLAMMGLGTLLEMLGVGLIGPALVVLSQPDPLARLPVLAAHWPAGWPRDQGSLTLGVMGALLAVFAFKNAFLVLLFLRQARFVYLAKRDLAVRLFRLYLQQPYPFHLQRNSSEMLQTLSADLAVWAGTVLWAFNLLVEILMLTGICLVLLLVEPLGALAVFVTIGATAAAFLGVTRRRLNHWGAVRQHNDREVLRQVQEALGAIKELKVLGREEAGVGALFRHASGSAQGNIRLTVYPQLPRLGLEFVAVGALVGLVALFLWQGRPVEAILPSLGLFAAAAFRVMPAANRLITAAQGLQGGLSVIDTLHAEFSLLAGSPAPVPAVAGSPLMTALTIEEVSFRYDGAAREALQGVSLTIARGATVGFIGSSGAGKSTLVDLVLGLLTPGTGRILVDGRDLREALRGWQAQLGYVPQAIFLTDDTLRRNVALGIAAESIDEAAVWRALTAAQLDAFVRELPEGLDTVVGERGVRLSGGQRQRIGIARALYHDPAVLVLDEATSALDGETEAGVMAAVQALQGEKTILIIAHRLSTVAHCDVVHRLEGGRVVASGRLDEVGG